ncbi:MAG: hypothetical protein ACXW27_06675 [Allosphingosinicella sp.]
MKFTGRLRLLHLRYVASRSLGRRDARRSVEAFRRIEEIAGLSLVEEAQLATALLYCGDPRAAQRGFSMLQKKLSSSSDERYIQKYCRYYLALIRNERSQADYERRLAEEITPRPRNSRRLPMDSVPERARPGAVAALSLGEASGRKAERPRPLRR